MTKLFSGVTTNVILMPGFYLWFSGIVDLLENDFGCAFSQTFLFWSLKFYEVGHITDIEWVKS